MLPRQCRLQLARLLLAQGHLTGRDVLVGQEQGQRAQRAQQVEAARV